LLCDLPTAVQLAVDFYAEIALAAQRIPPIPTHFSVLRGLSVVCLSHSCSLLKPSDAAWQMYMLLKSNDILR